MNFLIFLLLIQKSIYYVTIHDSAYTIESMDLHSKSSQPVLSSLHDITAIAACTTGLIAYRTNDGIIKIYDVRYRSERVLVAFTKTNYPIFSPDGIQIAYCQDKPGNQEIRNIMLFDIIKNTTRQLSNDDANDNAPSFLPSAPALIITRSSPGKSLLLLLNVNDGVTNPILANDSFFDYEPAVSPDGLKLAFSSNREGSFDLWIYYLNDYRLERVTQESGCEGRPLWINDQCLVYEANYPDGWGIWQVSIKNKETERLTPIGEKCRFPAVGY